MILKIVEVLGILLAIWFFASQIIFPALTKRPWFPLFREERRDVEAEILAANEAADVAELKKSLPVKKDENASF